MMSEDNKPRAISERVGEPSKRDGLSGFKQAGSISAEPESPVPSKIRVPRYRFHHGVAATCILITALLLRIVVMIGYSSPSQTQLTVYFLLSILSAIVWIWGCVHFAKNFGLPGIWGAFGIFFIFGLAVIYWAGRQKPKWDKGRSQNPSSGKFRGGDPNSLY